MPDFQQFADTAATEKTRLIELNRICADPTCRGCHVRAQRADHWEQAERHARLLQQVWEWANAPTEDQAAWHAEAPETARIALDCAKAFVRSCLLETPLLAGEPEEKTR